MTESKEFDPDDEVLTPEETCHFLRLSRNTLIGLRKRAYDPLPFLKIGSSIRFLKSQVLSWAIRNQAVAIAGQHKEIQELRQDIAKKAAAQASTRKLTPSRRNGR